MKKLYLLPVALLLLFSCQKEKKETGEEALDATKTDLYTAKLKGNVKSVSEKSFSYTNGVKGGPAGEQGWMDSEVQYSTKGMLVSEKKLNAGTVIQETTYSGKNMPLKMVQFNNGTSSMVTQYTYNKKGIKTSEIRRTGNNIQIDKTEMIFKGKNMVEKNSYNNQNTLTGKVMYAYDKSGNVVEENIYNQMQVVELQITYEYDSKGHKTSETGYNSGKISYKTSYTYDGDKLMNKITTNGSGIIEFADAYKYDSNGNVTEHETFEPAIKRRSIETNAYDKNNKLLSVIIMENNKLQSRSAYSYDKNNNIVSVKMADAKGKLVDDHANTYIYDTQGNWTQKEIKINGKPAYVIERDITYYQ